MIFFLSHLKHPQCVLYIRYETLELRSLVLFLIMHPCSCFKYSTYNFLISFVFC
jgi:hypothetical protein